MKSEKSFLDSLNLDDLIYMDRNPASNCCGGPQCCEGRENMIKQNQIVKIV